MSTEQMSAQRGSYPETERYTFADLAAMAPPTAAPAALTEEEQELELELIASFERAAQCAIPHVLKGTPSLAALVRYGEAHGGFIRLVTMIGRSQSSHPAMVALQAELEGLLKDPVALAARWLTVTDANLQAQADLDRHKQTALGLVEDLMAQGQLYAVQLAAETFGLKIVVMSR